MYFPAVNGTSSCARMTMVFAPGELKAVALWLKLSGSSPAGAHLLHSPDWSGVSLSTGGTGSGVEAVYLNGEILGGNCDPVWDCLPKTVRRASQI